MVHLAVASLVFTTGSGVRATWLPVLISCVNKGSIATLCAIASIVENFGVLMFAPLLALAATKGFSLHGTRMGLPFFCVSVSSSPFVSLGHAITFMSKILFLLGLLIVMFFQPPLVHPQADIADQLDDNQIPNDESRQGDDESAE